MYWTSISKDGDKALVFNIDAYFSQSDDEELRYKSQGHSIRCFQNTEEYVVDNPSVTDVTAPLTGSETPEDDLPLCEERGTACGGEVDNDTQDSPVDDPLLLDEGTGQNEAGDDEQAKTDSNDSSVLDYLFHEGAE